MRRYRVMVNSGDLRFPPVSADFPFPNTTHYWLGAVWLAWRWRKRFHVTILRTEDQ